MDESMMHPENIDPPWFQELVRRAYDRHVRLQMTFGKTASEAEDLAMWYVFEIRKDLTSLYQAGAAEESAPEDL